MRRVLIDFFTVGLLIIEEALMHVLSQRSEVALDLIADNILLIRIGSAIAVACLRAFLEVRVFEKAWLWWAAGAEWIAIIMAANVAVCWLDVIWNPADNFKTVFGFNLLIVVLPTILASTVAYLVCLLTVPTAAKTHLA